MDRIDPRNAQIIPFPKGGRDALRRQAAALTSGGQAAGLRRPEIDHGAWYHQAAMQESSAPRQS